MRPTGALRVAALAVLFAAGPAGVPLPAAAVIPETASPEISILPPGADRSLGIAVTGNETFVLALPRDPERVIVQFRSPPRLAATDRRAAMFAIERDHSGFAADLARLAAGLGPATVTRTYRECLNGVALTAPAAVVERLRTLPYVRRVVPDDSVRVQLDASVPLIGADQAWTRFGVTGQGVTVAILDTGIDYMHDALGGGFGPGYKVAGGYDFVNDDADPRDDHFHGTHVAGIVAGDGIGLKGVAPDATLYAYKVLDAQGGGSWSGVIAGIERAADPDQDPSTDDAVDVMNLSLAGPGDATHPASEAIDAASAAGIVCVVAAGNRGGYFTVGAPAAAARAITVGATDKQDQIASFSSRGPLPGVYTLKPDVMAPGVGIASAMPGGFALPLSGTSMAAPHVAGAAALLLQAHPGWTPDQVKAALMNTARAIAGGVAERGAGRIDVPAALDPAFLVGPASVSIPRPPTGGPPFADARPLTVTNVSAQPVTVELGVDFAAKPGIAISIVPPSVTIAPGDSAVATVTFAIDPAALPYPDVVPFMFAGGITARSGARTHRVPFGFVRGIEVMLDGPDVPGLAVLHDHVQSYWTWHPAMGPPLALLRPGRYDLVTTFFPRLGEETAFVVREGLMLDRDQTLSVARAHATLPLSIEPVDETGRPVEVQSAALTLWTDGLLAIRLPGLLGRFRSTPMSEAYRMEWEEFVYVRGVSFYDFRGTLRGLREPTVFRNSPSDLRRFPVRIPTDPEQIKNVNHYRWMRAGRLIFGFEYVHDGVEGDVHETANITPRVERSLGLGFSKRVAHPRAFSAFNDPMAFSPILDVVVPGRVLLGHTFDPTQRILDVSAQGFGLDLDGPPPVWIGRLSYNPTTLYLSSQFTTLRSRVFTSPTGGIVEGDDPRLWIVRDGAVVDSGFVTGAGKASPEAAEYRHALPGGGPVRVVIEAPPYTLAGVPGHVRVEGDLAGGTGGHLPWIRQLAVLADGAPADSIPFDRVATAELRLKVLDDAGAPRIAAWLAPSGTAEWLPLGAATDTALAAALPDTLNGLVALRVEALDAAGNRLVYTADPAYRSLARLTSVVRAAEVAATPAQVALLWRLPSGAAGPFPVHRRTLHTDWVRIGEAHSDGDAVRFADDDVGAGRRYEYAILVPSPAGEALAGATVVDVPGARPMLFGILPNPGPGNLRVSFSLGSNAPATLELVDVAGRRLRRVEVGHLGAGEHGLDLGEGLNVRAGIYWVRLQQSGVTQVIRAAVIR